jgi:hypothetical protein
MKRSQKLAARRNKMQLWQERRTMYSKRKLHLATMFAFLAFSGLAWGDAIAQKAPQQSGEAFVNMSADLRLRGRKGHARWFSLPSED